MPQAILASVSAVAGAITSASAHKPRLTWLFHCPFSGSKKSTAIGFFVSVAIVSGVMNCRAIGVITTRTSAPRLTSSRASAADL